MGHCVLSPLHVYSLLHVTPVPGGGRNWLHATCDVLTYVLYIAQFGCYVCRVCQLYVNYCSCCIVTAYRVGIFVHLNSRFIYPTTCTILPLRCLNSFVKFNMSKLIQYSPKPAFTIFPNALNSNPVFHLVKNLMVIFDFLFSVSHPTFNS